MPHAEDLLEKLIKTWPVVLACITGLCYLLGYARYQGFRATLGIAQLDATVSKEDLVLKRFFILVQIFYMAVLLAALVVASRALAASIRKRFNARSKRFVRHVRLAPAEPEKHGGHV